MSSSPIAAMVKSEEVANVVMDTKGKSIPNTLLSIVIKIAVLRVYYRSRGCLWRCRLR
jgi:hypothetical protein